jgi:SAM-dependent methyltransferase
MGMRTFRRIANGIRKIAAGLTPFGESVWPGVRNDLFVAHESIYHFFSSYVPGKRVFDAGCGTGYGAARLADSGAKEVIAVDLDHRSIRYASRHFSAPNIRFAVVDLETRLPLDDGMIDVAVSSNCLEHLRSPGNFVADLRRVLHPEGVAVVAVPPITNEALAREHEGIHYHHSTLTVSEWFELFEAHHLTVVSFVRHGCQKREPDFRALGPSDLVASDFFFESTTLQGLYQQPTITAIFVLRYI